VPEGTLGTIESDVVSWDNGDYTIDAARSVDYAILKGEAITASVASDDKLGEEVSAEDLGKAFSDLTGMGRGDRLAVLRSDGRWTYAQAIKKSGTSRSGTGVGFMLTVRIADGMTKDFPFNDWDKVKQFNEPRADRGWGGWGRKSVEAALATKLAKEAANPLMAKIGEEASEADLSKASADLSNVVTGDVVLSLRSDGKWHYARVKEFIGTTRSASGAKFGNPDVINPGEEGTGMLLRVDQDGSEKKVLSTELEKVKAI